MSIYSLQYIKESQELESFYKNMLDLCQKYSKYKYIMIDENGNITNNQKLHKTLSKSEFEKYHSGICYDYVNTMTSNIPYKHKTFFTCWMDKNNTPTNTHTYILVYFDYHVYWIESSWKSHIGVIEFENEDDALSYISDLIKKNNYTVQYTPNSRLIGISIDEFINQMAEIPEYNFKYNKEIKYKNVNRRWVD